MHIHFGTSCSSFFYYSPEIYKQTGGGGESPTEKIAGTDIGHCLGRNNNTNKRNKSVERRALDVLLFFTPLSPNQDGMDTDNQLAATNYVFGAVCPGSRSGERRRNETSQRCRK